MSLVDVQQRNGLLDEDHAHLKRVVLAMVRRVQPEIAALMIGDDLDAVWSGMLTYGVTAHCVFSLVVFGWNRSSRTPAVTYWLIWDMPSANPPLLANVFIAGFAETTPGPGEYCRDRSEMTPPSGCKSY